MMFMLCAKDAWNVNLLSAKRYYTMLSKQYPTQINNHKIYEVKPGAKHEEPQQKNNLQGGKQKQI